MIIYRTNDGGQGGSSRDDEKWLEYGLTLEVEQPVLAGRLDTNSEKRRGILADSKDFGQSKCQ